MVKAVRCGAGFGAHVQIPRKGWLKRGGAPTLRKVSLKAKFSRALRRVTLKVKEAWKAENPRKGWLKMFVSGEAHTLRKERVPIPQRAPKGPPPRGAEGAPEPSGRRRRPCPLGRRRRPWRPGAPNAPLPPWGAEGAPGSPAPPWALGPEALRAGEPEKQRAII